MADEGYRLGNLPDEYDSRDYPIFPASEVQALQAVKTSTSEAGHGPPESFILPDLPPIYNQLYIGSCTANASCAALRYAHRKSSGRQYKDFEPSRLFAYYYGRIDRRPEELGKTEELADIEKRIQEGIKKDTGSNNRKIIHTFLTQGICTDALWPYGTPSSDKSTHLFNDISKLPNPCEPKDWNKVSWQAKPVSHLHDGKDLAGEKDLIPRNISYYRIYDPSVTPTVDPKTQMPISNWQIIYNNPPVALLEKSLTSGFPFIFGTRLYNGASLESSEIDKNGVFVKPPTKDFKDKGGHALVAVGFDSSKRLFLVQNSWGKDWPANCKDEKMKGRFWMPYEWFEAVVNGLPITYDFWVIKCGTATREVVT
ncbi:cysteine proteinase [Hyaloscypha variabilis F]|uniref:Cysteine proteinase n=1 Tax=Hyaloscypha variabilis (strain UAMH 11265 / GT02V1 / F) TaxID=1149755 RepID=A0A2J6S5P3_HYAVF|nr:cysteine proteinase [Hyaloscypha variabilis F]